MTTPFTMKSVAFRQEREATWLELEDVLDQLEREGVRSLDEESLSRLPVLYRATVSSLSVARSISLDRNVLDYLDALVARAYLAVYGTRRGIFVTTQIFFAHHFPATVRKFSPYVLLAALIFGLGGVTGFVLTSEDSDRFYAFVDSGYAQGRDPGASTEKLRAGLYDMDTTEDELTAFASFLFSNNARIGLVAFALGFALGVPTILLLFMNGLLLGAFGALFHSRGLGVEFWAWILPHGVTEILALLLCTGAGLALGSSLIVPGPYSRLKNLMRRGREVGRIVLGAVVLFFLAALIEGIFRQVVHDVGVRYVVAAATALLWATYFTFAGRRGLR